MIIEAKFSPPKWGDPKTGCSPSKFKLPPVKPIVKVDGKFVDSYQDISGLVIVYRFFIDEGCRGWCRFVDMNGDLIEGRFECAGGKLCLI